MIVVEPATAGELGRVAELLSELSPDERVEALASRLAAELERPHARLLVSREGPSGEVVGALLAWHVADEVTVHEVVVDPSRRRAGHGRALVEALVATSFAEGAGLVLLEVRATNAPARALYGALGFREAHVRRGYYADGEDAVEMHLSRADLAR